MTCHWTRSKNYEKRGWMRSGDVRVDKKGSIRWTICKPEKFSTYTERWAEEVKVSGEIFNNSWWICVVVSRFLTREKKHLSWLVKRGDVIASEKLWVHKSLYQPMAVRCKQIFIQRKKFADVWPWLVRRGWSEWQNFLNLLQNMMKKSMMLSSHKFFTEHTACCEIPTQISIFSDPYIILSNQQKFTNLLPQWPSWYCP